MPACNSPRPAVCTYGLQCAWRASHENGLVDFSKEQQHTLATLQQLVAEKYLLLCYDDKSHTTLPELGEDYSSVYGYVQTHETLELWLDIWKAHNVNVRLNGTPPASCCFIECG